jgi:hypothetical protein
MSNLQMYIVRIYKYVYIYIYIYTYIYICIYICTGRVYPSTVLLNIEAPSDGGKIEEKGHQSVERMGSYLFSLV